MPIFLAIIFYYIFTVAGEAGGHITLTFGGGGGDGEGPFQRVHGNMGDYAWGDGGLDQVVTLLLNQLVCERDWTLKYNKLLYFASDLINLLNMKPSALKT